MTLLPDVETEAGGGPPASPDICIVMNVGSGDERAEETAREIRDLMAREPGRFTLRLIAKDEPVEETIRAIIEEGYRIIVAAGGDGTICAVAQHLGGTEMTMGVLPLGTFNYVARSLDLPETLPEAFAVITGGEARTLDIGEVNGRVFLNNASLGLYPTILKEREDIYRRWGRSQFAAYWSVLTTVLGFRSPLRLRVTIGGEVKRYKTPLVFVASSAYQLELFELDGADRIRAGQLAVFVAPDCSRWDLVRFAIRLALRRPSPDRDFDLLSGDEFVVESDRRQSLVARDGERERMESPFRFRLRQAAIKVMVPTEEG